MRSGNELVGIGIDIVSWSRVERFLAQHSFEFLQRLLTPAEQEAFQRARSPLQFVARCFTANEAYFKACSGGGIMGEAGFNQIETSMKGKNQFRAVSNSRSPAPRLEGEGNFFESPDGMGAQILIRREQTR